jgi:hypothetical protein
MIHPASLLVFSASPTYIPISSLNINSSSSSSPLPAAFQFPNIIPFAVLNTVLVSISGTPPPFNVWVTPDSTHARAYAYELSVVRESKRATSDFEVTERVPEARWQ